MRTLLIADETPARHALRRELESGGERRLLHTLRGVGYVLREP